jgi:hypothetical protein
MCTKLTMLKDQDALTSQKSINRRTLEVEIDLNSVLCSKS